MNKTLITNRTFSRVNNEQRRRCSYTHIHNEYEFYYLIKGNTKYLIENEEFKLSAGDAIFVPIGLSHSTDSEACTGVERVLVSFKDDIVDENLQEIIECLKRKKQIRIPVSKRIAFEEIFHRIEKEFKGINPYKDTMIAVCLKELLVFIARIMELEKSSENHTETKIRNIAEYISENFQDDITLSSLSAQFSFSEAHLSKKFKEILGIGVSKYINLARVEHSEFLLKTTNLSVTDIALECGFNDSNYFSTIFKKIIGITPLKYRAAYR